MVKGVMFDFSGTLLRIESVQEWLGSVLAAADVLLGGTEFSGAVRRLTEYGALPGAPGPARVPEHLEAVWRERDLTPDQHRAAYTGLTRRSSGPPVTGSAWHPRMY
jgi:hypothetical protein